LFIFILSVLYLAFDFDFEEEHPDFLERGGFDDGGRILFCDISP
jgi:hypothetical protein